MAAVEVPAEVPLLVQHVLPAPFSSEGADKPPREIVTQGAEALLYRTTFLTPDKECALKYRPSKSYRHAILDARLTKQRVLAEARVLSRCSRESVPVPALLGLDWESGWLAMEWIDGSTVRSCLDVYLRHGEGVQDATTQDQRLKELEGLMGRIGKAVGRLHEVGITHGDLTTSNIMLRTKSRRDVGTESSDTTSCLDGDVILIDFGLASQNIQDEDKAVDLYVLERAFGSTHPEAEDLFKEVLRIYGESYKGAKGVLKRLDDVRLRGRKKSMLG